MVGHGILYRDHLRRIHVVWAYQVAHLVVSLLVAQSFILIAQAACFMKVAVSIFSGATLTVDIGLNIGTVL